MKTANLSHEIEHAAKAVRNPHLVRLLALGVTSATIARLGAVQPPFGVMDCENLGSGIFQPGGETSHIVQPVYDGGVLIDIIAWRTVAPQNWLWRCGAAWALNPDAIADNSWNDEPLAVEATPLDWLRYGATGLCILDWTAPEIRNLLRIPSITVDRCIEQRLRSALLEPANFPEILAREGLRDAA